VPHQLSPLAKLVGIGRVDVAQTLLSVLVRLGTFEKINPRRQILTSSEKNVHRRLRGCKQMDVRKVGVLIEMTSHRVAHVLFKCREIVRLGEDRLANGAGRVASVGGFFDEKNEIVHRLILLRGG